jgi:transposase-like protein
MVAKLPARFTDEEAARAHLEALNWPEGPICPHCGVVDEASRIKGGRKGLLFCNACRTQFTVTVGTVFERSKVPLNTWLYVNHLLCASKKGISAKQISRMVGVTYKTAWFMCHRIREAMNAVPGSVPPMGGEGKTIEADETYIGRREGMTKERGTEHKVAVVALVERGGAVRSFHVGKARKINTDAIVKGNAHPASNLMTDESRLYKDGLGFASHSAVNHGKGEYGRGNAHTNTIEGVFSIFKRGMVGTYQHCGEQHLQRYLNEFDFRYSNREKLGVDDAMRADRALKGIVGKRLTYRRTIG